MEEQKEEGIPEFLLGKTKDTNQSIGISTGQTKLERVEMILNQLGELPMLFQKTSAVIDVKKYHPVDIHRWLGNFIKDIGLPKFASERKNLHDYIKFLKKKQQMNDEYLKNDFNKYCVYSLLKYTTLTNSALDPHRLASIFMRQLKSNNYGDINRLSSECQTFYRNINSAIIDNILQCHTLYLAPATNAGLFEKVSHEVQLPNT